MPFAARHLVAAALALMLGSTPALANAPAGDLTIHCDDDASAGGTGLTWNDAFRFLQDAIAYANEPANGVSEIRVAQGTYSPDRDETEPDGSNDRRASFVPPDDVALRGGFAGLGAPDPDALDPDVYVTVLTGDLDRDDSQEFYNYGENSFHVLRSVDSSADTSVSGFTIRGGFAVSANPEDQVGAGVHLTNAMLTISACRIVEHWSETGGAVFDDAGAARLVDCVVRDNRGDRGAGYLSRASATVISGCRFEANDVADGHGGAVLNEAGGTATFESCFFAQNVARFGRGIKNEDSDVFIVDCTFEDHLEPITAALGGAIYNFNSSPEIAGCVFARNRAGDGGAVYNQGFDGAIVTPSFADCVFVDNIGNAVYDVASEAVYTNCIFIGNSGAPGGAARTGGATARPQFIACTFELNTADTGGAIACLFSARMLVRDCVFEGNLAGEGGAIFQDRGHVEVVESIFRGNIALGRGGAIGATDNGRLDLRSCLLAGNRAGTGGGISTDDFVTVSIAHSTVVENTAEDGGGLWFDKGTAAIVNSIVWGNVDPRGAVQRSQIDPSFATVVVDYSCIQYLDGSLGGEGNIGDDPLFVENDDRFHLSDGSPCVNTGTRVVALDPDAQDIDGDPRLQVCRIDMGADETPYEGIASPDCNGNGVADECDVFDGTSPDCNVNGIPDECDIETATSVDCDENGVPDECEPDCNANGVTDACDIRDGTSIDCDDNAVPDECEVGLLEAVFDSGPLSPIGDTAPQEYAFPMLPPAEGDPLVRLTAHADLSSSSEYIDVFLDEVYVGRAFRLDASDCPAEPDAEEFFFSRALFNDLRADGVVVRLDPSSGVSGSACDGASFVTISLVYPVGNDNDCNLNDVPDACDIDSGSSNDCNGNGIPDDCECGGDVDRDCDVGFGDVLTLLRLFGDCPECPEDLDGNGAVDFGDLLIVLANWGPCP